MSSQERESGTKKGGWLKDTLSVLLLACIIAFAIKMFVIDTRMIPSESMLPTIEIGDRVIVCRFSYWFDASPERGDIIVFRAPVELNEKDDLIKRVIGLPGETVEATGGKVYVDGVALDEPYILEAPDYEFGPVEVPENSYLVLGDNRNESYDSHLWMQTFIVDDDIKGKAIWRYWPIDRLGKLDK